MSVSAFLAWVLVLSVVPAAIAVIVSRRSPTAPGQIVPWLSGTTFVLALTALLAPMMVAANLDAGDWRQANLTVGAPWVAAIGACAITAFCARLARRLEAEAGRAEACDGYQGHPRTARPPRPTPLSPWFAARRSAVALPWWWGPSPTDGSGGRRRASASTPSAKPPP